MPPARNIDILLRFKPRPRASGYEKTVSQHFTELADKIASYMIDSRDKTISLERLEEAYKWARDCRWIDDEYEDEPEDYDDFPED